MRRAALLCAIVAALPAAAQDARSRGTLPLAAAADAGLTVVLPPVRTQERSAGLAGDDGTPSPGPAIVGFGRDLGSLRGAAVGPQDLVWESTPEGGAAATVAIVSPGAAALRAQLLLTAPPPELEVGFYDPRDPERTVTWVPHDELRATHSGADGGLVYWSPIVPGERIAVAFYLPPGASRKVVVSIPRVSHLDPPDRHDSARFPTPSCGQTHAVCRTEHISDTARSSVAFYYFTNQHGSTGVCTGVLLNDVDPTTRIPYFLSAQHCAGTAAQAATMEFYWFYEKPTCGGPSVPSEELFDAATYQGGGATYVSKRGRWDYALMRLNRSPPAGVGMAGWTSAPVSVGDEVAGVHHPYFQPKMILRGDVIDFVHGSAVIGTPTTHVKFLSSEGISSGGSSGSPIWKRIDGEDYVIGVIHGSTIGCDYDRVAVGRLSGYYPLIREWIGAESATAAGEAFHAGFEGLALVDATDKSMLLELFDEIEIDPAELAARSFDFVAHFGLEETPGSVRFDLSGALSVSRTANGAPHSLHGVGGTGLAPGSYTLAASAYASADAGGAVLASHSVAFAVAGTADPADMAVAAAWLVDGADGTPLGELRDGRTIVVDRELGAPLEIRAATAGAGPAASVGFALSGVRTAAGHANGPPFAWPVALPPGTYGLSATPYADADGGGAAGEPLDLADVTVEYPAARVPVRRLTLVDASDGSAVMELVAGAALDLDATSARSFDIRAEMASGAVPGSVRIALSGDATASRVRNAAPYALHGGSGGGGLGPGAYTVTATPYPDADGGGAAWPARTVPFTVAGAAGEAGVAVSKLALVDAARGREIAVLAAGAVAEVRGMPGWPLAIRADTSGTGPAASVRFDLTGAVQQTYTANGAPFEWRGTLPAGAYAVTATPYAEADLGGAAGTPLSAAGFEVAYGYAGALGGFALVDGATDLDVAALTDGATVDLASTSRRMNIRIDIDGAPDVGSIGLALTGPRSATFVRDGGASFTLFGEVAPGDVDGRPLPNGAYTVAGTFYDGPAGTGAVWTGTAGFTVTGSYAAGVGPVAGFTAVDAEGGAPDADVAAVTDGGVVDLSSTSGRVIALRADLADDPRRLAGVQLDLAGPVSASRWEPGGAPHSLYGEAPDLDYAGAPLPAGAYTVVATAYAAEPRTGPVAREGNVRLVGGADPSEGRVEIHHDGLWGTVCDQGWGLDDVRVACRQLGFADARAVPPRGAFGPRGTRVWLRGVDCAGDESGLAECPHGGWGAHACGRLKDAGAVCEPTPLAPVTRSFHVVNSTPQNPVEEFAVLLAEAPPRMVGSVVDDGVLDLSGVGSAPVTFRAVVPAGAGGVGSVLLELRRSRSVSRLDSEAAYTLHAFDAGRGVYAGGVGLVDGDYAIAATGYSAANGGGVSLGTVAAAFTVVGGGDPPAIAAGFAVVDPARPAEVLATVGDGALLDLAALAASAEGVDVRPVLAVGGATPGSVRIELGGTRSASHLAERSPFYLFGTQSGGVPGGVPMATGEYSIAATTFAEGGGRGWADDPVTARFTVVSRPPPWEGFALPSDGAAGNLYPSGLWSDGATLWIADLQSAQVFAFAMADKARLASRDIATAARQPAGLWSDGTTLRVADYGGGKLYAYWVADGGPAPAQDIELAPDNARPSGLWSDGDTLWVADYGARRVFAYGLAAGERRPAADLETAAAVKRPWGLWSDGDTLWVADWTGGAIRAYGLADDARRAHLDIDTAAHGNANPMGLHSDGDLLWASDSISRRVYVYSVPGPGSVSVASASASVVEGTAAVFTLARTGATDEALEVSVAVTETGSMLVPPLPATARFEAGSRTAALSLATVGDTVVEPASVVAATLTAGSGYAVARPATAEVTVADDDVAAFSVTASPASLAEGAASTLTVSTGGATFATAQSIELSVVAGTAAADDYGLAPGTLTLAPGAASVAATLTAVDDALPEAAETATVAAVHDGVEVGRATVTILPSAAPSADATLSAFALSGIDIGTFAAETTSYAARVALAVTATTATATANDPGAGVVIADAAGSTAGTARTVALAVGANVVTATVTAADGATTRTYSVAVARSGSDIDTLAAAGNQHARGLWSDGETVWVTDYADSKLYAYDLADGGRLGSRDIATWDGVARDAARYPTDAWSDGETVWVADNERDRVYAYRLSDGRRESGRDPALAAGNRHPNGVWGDGETLWAMDDRDAWAYAYRLSDGSRDTAREFAVPAAANRGLWSDGTTYWSADWGGRRALAFRNGERAAALDIDLTRTARPAGLWSDGRTVWVSDYSAGKLDAYLLPAASSHAALVLLRLAEADLGAFSPTVTAYAAAVPHTTARVTLTAHGAAGTRIAYTAADADPAAAGQQADLAVGANAIEVVVTAADGTTARTYTVTVTRATAVSDDATLSALSLSGIDIGAFSAATTAYAANVGSTVSETTVTATPAHAAATVAIADAAGSTAAGERTVALAEGANTITVAVTAEDGTATLTYAATVTRATAAPLTASFEDMPAAHDGATAFAFGLRFSEPVRTSFRTLRDEHLAVDGGTATRARRVDGNSAHWSITVRPDGAGDVAVRLPADVACDAGGVCTADGRRLANAPSATVAGPASSAVLAAARVSGRLVTLRYDAALDGGSTPAPADFVVLAGRAGAVAEVPAAAVRVADAAALLTLARAVRPEETVTLSYLEAPMHPLQDVAGRAAASLTDVAVRNDTPTAGAGVADGPPRASSAEAPPATPPDLSPWLADRGASAPLGRLDLSARPLPDPAALAALTGLRALNLADTGISDLAPLASLTRLEVLDLSSNAVADAGPLAGLTALERLDLSGNRIADVSALSGLVRLEVLLLDANRVADVAPLWSLQRLERLGLADNRVADVGLLAELASLKRLDLSGNAVADVSPLGDLSQLVWLRLPGNPVADAAPLGRLVGLRWLWLDAPVDGRGLLDAPARGPAAPLWIGGGVDAWEPTAEP